MATAFQIARLLSVIVLLVVAGALATEPGKLPLALRALERMMRKESSAAAPSAPQDDAAKSLRLLKMRRRRAAAFVIVILAAIIALV